MPYPNDNKLNIIVAQTSGSADGSGKFPFTEKIISGSNLFIVTNAAGELTGSTSIPSATFDNLVVNGSITASIISASTALTSAAATFTGPVSMSSTLSASGIYDAGTLTVVGTTTLTNITASGNMLFSGVPSSLNGANLVISASGANFSTNVGANTITATTSIVDGGSLTVLGNTVLGDALTDTLQVTGSTSLTGSFSVVGSMTGSSLTITGNSNLTTITGALSGSSVSTGNATINGGNINNTVIGGTTPAAGTFTNLTSTGNTILGNATSDLIAATGSVSISGSLSIVGTLNATSSNAISSSYAATSSTVALTDTTTGAGPYYVTFVDGTTGARSLRTDSQTLTWDATTNTLSSSGTFVSSEITSSTALFTNKLNFVELMSTGSIISDVNISASAVTSSNTVFSITSLVSTGSSVALLIDSVSGTSGTAFAISASRGIIVGTQFTGSSLSVTGNSTLTSITGALSGSSIQSGNATLTNINGVNVLSGAALVVSANAITSSTINVTSALSATAITSSNINVTGNAIITSITGALSGSSVSTGNATINGGNINNTVIGGTTPAAATFTNLTATGNTLLGDATSDSVKVTGSLSISGSLSVVGSIAGTIETASKVTVTNIDNTNSTYYVTFVPNTGSAQSISTDSSILSYNPNTNVLTIGVAASGSVVVGNNITMQDGGGSSQLRVGITTTDTASLLVSGNAFQVVKGTGATDRVSTNLPLSASNDVLFSSTTQATNFSNGALHVDGGVSISKNLYVSGSTFLAGDLTIYGSSSIVNISSSTLIIGDNRILLNAGSPIVRYAGIDVYDSGSGGIQSNVTSSFLWDSQTDSWLLFSANSGSGTFTTASSIIIGGPVSQFGNEGTLTTNIIPKVQSSGKNITNSLLSDNGTTLSYTGTGISASQITSSTALHTTVFSTTLSGSFITSSNALLTNVYSTTISSSLITASNLRVQLTGSITYATGVLVTYITGSFNTLTLSTGSFPGNAPGLVPNAPTSSGMPGQINVDNNFIYVYTNNVWKRVPLSQWSN